MKRRRRPIFETERAKAAVGGVPPEEKLRYREIWRSLVFLVGLPYIRAKAQDYFEALGGGIEIDVLDEGANTRQQRALSEPVCLGLELWLSGANQMIQTLAAKLRRLFKVLYPYAHTAFEVWLLVYNVAYLFEKTPYYRPWLSWVGVDLRRMGIHDMVRRN